MKNRDNLHFRWGRTLTYNKIWNYCIGERESGKSTDGWLKIWKAFTYEHRPSLVLRRRTADITSSYIDDTAALLNKFLDEPVQLLYLKGDIKQGIVDVKIGKAEENYSYAAIKKMPVFIRIISLSAPMGRIKSAVLRNVKYMFQDEFIVNLRANEKYLTGDEFFLKQEIYTTYNREAATPIKCLAAGNPYSVYCPDFVALGVDTKLLKPGAFVTGPNYVINCFQVPAELKEQILDANPNYQFDDSYRRYAFNGEAINDQNIRIHKCEPKGFKLKWVVRMGREYMSIHKGQSNDSEGKFTYWCCKHDETWLSKMGKRKIIVFNFGDMMAGTQKYNKDNVIDFFDFRRSMDARECTFNCIDASYMAEDIYSTV